MKQIIILFLLLNSYWLFAQNNVGIGTSTPNPQAVLDISSTDKGILVSRLTTVARMALGTALTPTEDGMLVYDKDLSKFFYWNGPNLAWDQVGTGTGDSWGNDVVNTSGTNITGDGTIAAPLTITEEDGDITNEIQDLTLDASTHELTISTNGTGSTSPLDLTPYLDNTDDQTLTLSGQTLSISNGNNVMLTDNVNDADADPANEIQDLTLDPSTHELTISTNGTGSASPLDLSPYLDNTDDQILTLTGQTLSISNGNNVMLTDNVNDADADPTNEYNMGVNLVGNNLNIIDGGGIQSVDLSNLNGHDWYEVGLTVQPDNITDDIFTQGNVGIGVPVPTTKLDIDGDLRVRNLPTGSDTDDIVVADASGNMKRMPLKLTDTWQAIGTTSIGISTKSWVDMPDMLLNITLVKEADVVVSWDATLYTGGSGLPWGAFRILVDGVPVNFGHLQANASWDQSISLSYIAQNLQAGNHAIKVQWAVGSTTSGHTLNNSAGSTTYLGGSKVWSRQLRAIAYYY